MKYTSFRRTMGLSVLLAVAPFSIAAATPAVTEGETVMPSDVTQPPFPNASQDAIDDSYSPPMTDIADGLRISEGTEMVMVNDEIVFNAGIKPEEPKLTEEERRARVREALMKLPKAKVHDEIDGNKLFEDLEDSLSKMGDTDTIEVFVHLNDLVESIGVESLEKAYGSFKRTQKFGIVPKIFFAEMSKEILMKLRDDPHVLYIEPNGIMEPHLNAVHSYTGVTQARIDWPWITGDGGDGETTYTTNDVVIAVLDSGIRQDHEAFKGQIVDGKNMKFLALKDFINDDDDPEEVMDSTCRSYGHGTAVASVAAGRQWVDTSGTYRGVAPGARLVIAKIMDCAGAYYSRAVTALDWLVSLKQEGHKLAAVNLSFGSEDCGSLADTTFMNAIRSAWNNQILPIAAAGNESVLKNHPRVYPLV